MLHQVVNKNDFKATLINPGQTDEILIFPP